MRGAWQYERDEEFKDFRICTHQNHRLRFPIHQYNVRLDNDRDSDVLWVSFSSVRVKFLTIRIYRWKLTNI